MKLIAIVMIAVSMVGCAARGYQKPNPTANLSSYIGGGALTGGKRCIAHLIFKDGQQLEVKVKQSVCERGAIFLSGQAAGIASAPKTVEKPTTGAN